MEGPQVRKLVDGATYLITNDYERALLETKDRLVGRRGARTGRHRITTRGPTGA
jgi:adenosine kinase